MAEKKPLKREHYCGQIGKSQVGQTITLYGWVSGKRELGGITFIDLRDREGVLQVVVNEHFPDHDLIKRIGREFVLQVRGTVAQRSNPNPQLPTGTVELMAEEITIVAESALPPFFPESSDPVSEDLRLRYRYIDMRGPRLQRNFKLRSQANLKVRQYLSQQGFIDIETPILSKATPEGARDYLVPSRIYKGKMFALPQSPQQFKQLLMVSGFERYFQICRCFRDEDLRADRQPEFTQIDIEMSFAEPAELMDIVEGLLAELFGLRGIPVSRPFLHLSYRQAIEEYGSEKPDLRIPYKIRDFSSRAGELGSTILNNALAAGSKIRGLVLPQSLSYSRKALEAFDGMVKNLGGKGAIWMKKDESGFKSSLKIEAPAIESFFKANGLTPDSLVLLVADTPDRSLLVASKLREQAGKNRIKPGSHEFLWVTDFPLFFFNEEEKRLDSNHHPFTSPHPQDIARLEKEPLAIRSLAYDVVLNGVEIGGGSQRIHDPQLQRRVFQLLGLSDEEIEDKFGFFIQALQYGTPPHLGIALGFDRILMLLAGEESIREMIAFPKTTSSLCLLTGSPTKVSAKQLEELGLILRK